MTTASVAYLETTKQNDIVTGTLQSEIDFFNVARDKVAVEIKLTNESGHPSARDTAIISAAPFGVFVPWTRLLTLPVPALLPGKVHFLRSTFVTPRPQLLGSPDRVPPRKLLTALGLADDPPQQSDHQKQTQPRTTPSIAMPPDLMELLLQDRPHWAGNINVHVGRKDVERHLARALRIYPGRLNLAWFFVGSGGPDAYRFHLQGLASDWEAKLFDMTERQSLVLKPNEGQGLALDRWLEAAGTRVLMLALRPPRDCAAGVVAVHVTQQSSGRTAVVEVSLDPAAAGRGCYVV
jgi:hypothetical protein